MELFLSETEKIKQVILDFFRDQKLVFFFSGPVLSGEIIRDLILT
jgi:hypothetical protein